MIVLMISAAILIFFQFYSPKPKSFDEKEAAAFIKRYFPEKEVSEYLDIIFLDDAHVYTPFVTVEGRYGMSFWSWEKNKWEMAGITDGSQPYMWMIDQKSADSYYIMWNIHPDEKLESLRFYIRKDRNYSIRNGTETYTPKILMETSVAFQDHAFHVMKLPESWQKYLQPLLASGAQKTNHFWGSGAPMPAYSWQAVFPDGTTGYPELEESGSGSYIGSDLFPLLFEN